jgi:hypothetical protein
VELIEGQERAVYLLDCVHDVWRVLGKDSGEFEVVDRLVSTAGLF